MRGVMLHAVLSVIGLFFAYQTWTREEEIEAPAGEVTIAECSEGELTSVELETTSQRVTARTTKGASKTEYWVTTQRQKPKVDPAKPAEAPKAPEAKPDDKASKAADPTPPAPKAARPYDADAPVVFLANAKLTDVMKKLTPLRAVRALGEISQGQLKAFGLDNVQSRVRLECKGRKIELEVGGRTFGSGHQYARDPKTKQAYLLDGQLVLDLQGAQYKFIQNELHEFAPSEVDEAVIQALGKERRLAHRNRLTADQARWVDAAEPDRRNELFGNWFGRVSKLRAKTYLPEGAKPGADLQIEASAAKPVVTIDYRLEGKPKGKLEIVRVDTAQGNFYYLRSEATGQRWVSTFDSATKQVEDDVAMVVGAEEAPPESSNAPAHKASPAALPAGHPPVPK